MGLFLSSRFRFFGFVCALLCGVSLLRAGYLNNPYPNANYGVLGTLPSITYGTNAAGLPDYRTGSISYSRTFSGRNSEGIWGDGRSWVKLYVDGELIASADLPTIGSGSSYTVNLSVPNQSLAGRPNASVYVEAHIYMWNQGGADQGNFNLDSTSDTAYAADGTNVRGQVDVKWDPDPSTWQWDGNSHAPVPRFERRSDFYGNGNVPTMPAVAYNSGPIPLLTPPTGAGSYTATVGSLSPGDAENYVIFDGGSQAFSITKAPMNTPTTDNLDANVGQPWNPIITGGTGDGAYFYAIPGQTNFQNGPWNPLAAGNVTFFVAQVADGNHFGNATDPVLGSIQIGGPLTLRVGGAIGFAILPTATISANPGSITVGQSTNVSAVFTEGSPGSVSATAIDGNGLSPAASGGAGSGAVGYTFTPSAPGSYTFYARINYNGSWGTYATTTVTVNSPPPVVPPTASISAFPGSISVGQTTTITANFVENTPGTLANSTIDGDGKAPAAAGGAGTGSATYNFTPTAAGTYIFLARILYNGSWGTYATCLVTVTDGGGIGPSATISISPGTISVGQTGTITATFVDSSTPSIQGSKIAGEGGAALANGPAGSGTFTYDFTPTSAGTYTFQAMAQVGGTWGTYAVLTFTVGSGQPVIPPEPATYVLSLSANVPGRGMVSGAGAYVAGTIVKVDATPSPGFYVSSIFGDFNAGGDPSGGTVTTWVSMFSNRAATVNFVPRQFAVFISSRSTDGLGGGTTAPGGGAYNFGDWLNASATPNASSRFMGWVDENGTSVGSVPTYTVQVTQNINLYALFAAKLTQSITFVPELPKEVTLKAGMAPLTINAVASSGLPVTLTLSPATVTDGIATLDGNVLTFVKSGSVVFVASQPGDGTYFSASDVTVSIAVGKASTVTYKGDSNVKIMDSKNLGHSNYVIGPGP